MAKRSRVIDRDLGFRAVVKRIGDLTSDPFVVIGIRAEEGSELVTYAAANEFGTDTIPERSYLRSTIDENRDRYFSEAGKAIRDHVNGRRGIRQGMGRLGLRVVADVQRKITALREPPNAPSTIAQKGSDNPLIDTGRLRQSIDFEVRED